MAKKVKQPVKSGGAQKNGRTQLLRDGKEAISLRTPMQYIVRAFVIAMFLYFPLNMSTNYTLIYAKERTFYLLFIFMVAAAAFVLFYQLLQGRRLQIEMKGFFKRIRPYEYAMLAYWVVLSISALSSPYRDQVWAGASGRGEGYLVQCLYLLTVAILARAYKPNLKDLLILCIGCTIVCGYGIFQYYGLDFLKLSTNAEYGPNLTLVTTMSNRNLASTYFVIAFCAGYTCFTQKKEKWQWAFFPLSLIIFYMILLGDTESGFAGVLFAGALSLALVANDRKSAARLCLMLASCVALMWVHGMVHPLLAKGWAGEFPASNVEPFMPALPVLAVLLFGLAALFQFVKKPAAIRLPAKAWLWGWPIAFVALIAVVILALPAFADATEIRSLQQLADILRGNVDDTFMSGRVFVWRRAMTLVPDRLLLGYGPDQFMNAFAGFYDESSAVLGVWFDKVHSEYIQLLVDVGLLGLLAMLAFYVLAFLSARKRWRDGFTLAAGVAMLCFCIQAVFNFSTHIAHPVVWTMWGLFLAAAAYREEEIS